MLFISRLSLLFFSRLLLIGLLGVGITAATTAQAAVKLFTAEWYTKGFGNECSANLTGAVGPYCTRTTGNFKTYSAFGVPPLNNQNGFNPVCHVMSTPTDGKGKFKPLGTTMTDNPNQYCLNLSLYGTGLTVRPAKGATPRDAQNVRIPPLYRNPYFFYGPSPPPMKNPGSPIRILGTPTSTGKFTTTQTRFGKDKGNAQKGEPIVGTGRAGHFGATNLGSFFINQAPATIPTSGTPSAVQHGIRTTMRTGSFPAFYPYLYSYTYGNMRNAAGLFGPGQGPGSFLIEEDIGGGSIVARIKVTAGKNQFGGTMRMLGSMTTKVCYWAYAVGGGCSVGVNNWRYEAIGVKAQYDTMGNLTMGATNYTFPTTYYNTKNGKHTGITNIGSRFPWTTGAVTVTAIGRGPHKTIHYFHGYDNRNTETSLGKGTIQLVTPIITRWDGTVFYETGGIGVLRIKFVPEPQTWAILIAGVSLLGVGYRMRGR